MSIQFNMTKTQELGQEGFMQGISNLGGSGGDFRTIKKQSLSPLPFYASQILIAMDKKIAKGKKRTKRSDKNNDEESPNHESHIWTERERRKKMRDMFAKLQDLLPQLPPKADKSTIVDEAVSFIKSREQTIQKLQIQIVEKLQHSSASNTTNPFTYDPSSSSSPLTLLTPIKNPQILPVNTTAADPYARETFMADQIAFSSTATAVNMPIPCTSAITVFDTWFSSNVVLNICGNEAFFTICFPKDKPKVFSSVCLLFDKYDIEVLSASISSNVFRNTYMIQAQVNLNGRNQLLMGNGNSVGEIYKQVAQDLMLFYSSPQV